MLSREQKERAMQYKNIWNNFGQTNVSILKKKAWHGDSDDTVFGIDYMLYVNNAATAILQLITTCGIEPTPLDKNDKNPITKLCSFLYRCNILQSPCQCHHVNFVSKNSPFYCACLVNALTLSNKCKVISYSSSKV